MLGVMFSHHWMINWAGGSGGAFAPPPPINFGRSVNPNPTRGPIPTTLLLVPPCLPPRFSDLPPALWSIGRCLEISNYKNSIVPKFPIAIWRVLDQEENTYRWEQQLITFILLKMPHPCVCFIFVVIYRGTLSWPIELCESTNSEFFFQ